MAQLQEAPRGPSPARDVAEQEMYITYELAQRTRGGGSAIFPRVKRVYIPGDVVEWGVGRFRKRSGRMVHGVRITYRMRDGAAPEEPRKAPRSTTNTAGGDTSAPARRFTQVIDLPDAARNVQLHEAQRPGRARVRAVR
jgi:hypothetical protein